MARESVRSVGAGGDPELSDHELAVNEVRLRGRLAVEPEARALPSGDVVVACRLVVDRRPVRTSGPGSNVRVDTLDLRRSRLTRGASS